MKYVIEHMEQGFTEWVILEYSQILKDVGRDNLILTSLPENTTESDIPKRLLDLGLQWTTSELTTIIGTDTPVSKLCLLDPRAEIDLQPEDKQEFDYFIFGGILGDHPPRDRTTELKVKLGCATRRLGSLQMTTDTAIRTTKLILNGNKFEDINFIDYPEIRFNKYEATEMPFRYILDEDSKPILPQVLLCTMFGSLTLATDEATDRNYLSLNIPGNILTPSIQPFQINTPGDDDDDGKCPPCFNCNLPIFECKQFSSCNPFSGRCECLAGFGGDDCSEPMCGGLGDGLNRPVRKDGELCSCEDGWSGINCNMCTEDSVCDAFVPGDLKGTCYKEGIVVKKSHQMCDVTNKKIVEILNGKKPQVTFSCNKTSESCDFQFWIAEDESFFCELSSCDFQYDLNSNNTHYKCQDVSCKCLADKMLCGQSGSIDISDFLTETIKGPGDFSCDIKDGTCKFSEPSMNDLITNVFGDPYITLSCSSGECLHASEIPSFDAPDKPPFGLIDLLRIAATIAGCAGIIGLAGFGIKRSPLFDDMGTIALPDDNESDSDQDFANSSLMTDYKPAIFSFEKVSYTVAERPILKNAFGLVRPGECLAIIGGSGAGKTTLLDILAGKNKSGQKSGNLCVNGEAIKSKQEMEHFQKSIGFVDQEDFLFPTLTVYETVLNSALLRLPRTMPTSVKKTKVLQILAELRILHIKDKLIGSDFERGISGGEKRRVAIACELVTSPSILFLDEPTSGLDSYNAFNVVESLVRLAKDFNRTIIFTIHQPRSNIVALFDKLLLLAEGGVVYSGNMSECNEFFGSNGYVCPTGYNMADYLIDITANDTPSANHVAPLSTVSAYDEENREHEHDLHEVLQGNDTDDPTSEWQHYASHRDDYSRTVTGAIKKKLDPKSVYNIFTNSLSAEQLHEQIKELSDNFNTAQLEAGDDAASSTSFFKGDPSKVKASFLMQLSILCSRTFKNSYRNPKLLMGHYALALIVGLFCSFIYYNVENNISGFQNRLGLFFFLLTLFGFSTLTGLHSFTIERIVFIRERSNNYYHPLSYYLSKIICDVIPLRLFPPIILMAIIYPLVGLNMEGNKFWTGTLILVLFNLATAVEILVIGILIKEPGSATMIGVLVLLFSLLFAGLFINKETIPSQIAWFENISVFHYGYEALSVNEVNGLVLKEKKYGLDISVPGAVILSTFGFDVGAVTFDIWWLTGMLGLFVILGYLGLHYFVYETR
ncbi:hypothetical protein CANARDRAFT_203144 [[Candida] arabinofermentans NRRL YB-2248]|uniref:ABC transporter domain-containing protein n=1 Tax=[Candida] arabinofermentans NRRL YB-2248 TaxID=983967 RepID=A0A1E4SVC4_9ASCO|nr:hypothetical protein CANARDRAFT_203144 [[Candida] arabinofermentans NRRL YB-2248]